ncbi:MULTISPECIES: ABC transporter substrate-binding protein [Halorussus]|uniref:ABC transporter substrate-binding protein n=1 Tax=Halorussus TaxID=1070314 RepID=UPI0020A12725|nr:ABC transporter substrate-binding protein [Halorussus vallis]USZ77370.1 ABC transporter substrate-binding protein [Halorussus vallis]
MSAAGAAGLAGCMGGNDGNGKESTKSGENVGNVNGGKTTTIKFWTLFGGGDGKAMKALVDEFNKQHDGIQIKRQRLPWDKYYDKLYTSLTGGNPPDLGVIHATRLAKYKDVVMPLGDHLGSGEGDKYVQSIWKKTQVDGKRLALPLDTHPVGLYYNKDIFEKAGLDSASPPTNFKELKDASNAIVSKTDKYAFNPGPYAGSSLLRTYLAFLNQHGGKLLTDDKSKAAFNDKHGLAVANFYSDLTGKWNWDKANSSEDRGTKAFRAGDLAMTVNGTWYYGVAKEQKFKWGMAKPFVGPGGSGSGPAWANSHTLAVPYKKNRSKAKTKAAVTAAKWLTQQNQKWGTIAGHLPASKSVLESKKLRNAAVWDKTLSTFYEMASNDQLVYMPQTKSITEYKEPIWKALEKIYSHKSKPKPALSKAEKEVNGILGK